MDPAQKDMRLRSKQCESMYASIVLCWVLVGVFVGDYVRGSRKGADIALYDRINPNTAGVESLVRLGGIGPATAASIIEYRQGTGEGERAFSKPSDLQGVKGIGPKTVGKIENFLSFEENTDE